MADAYAGLDSLGNRFSHRQKMQNLLGNLEQSKVAPYLIQHCRMVVMNIYVLWRQRRMHKMIFYLLFMPI